MSDETKILSDTRVYIECESQTILNTLRSVVKGRLAAGILTVDHVSTSTFTKQTSALGFLGFK